MAGIPTLGVSSVIGSYGAIIGLFVACFGGQTQASELSLGPECS